MNQLLSVNLDFSQLEKVIKSSVGELLAQHLQEVQEAQQLPKVEIISLPPLLSKTDLKKFLDIGDTKASELLNRADFPVCRELGHPRVPTALLMKWIEQHTDWTGANTGDGWSGKRKHGVA